MGVRQTWLALALATAASGCGGGGGGGGGITWNSIDLMVDGDAIADSLEIVDRFVDSNDCAFVEGSVGGTGVRRLLRFDTIIANLGELDLVIGDPAEPEDPFLPADFVYSPCHDHFHFEGFAEYQLLDSTGGIAAVGHKQAFCLLDSLPYVSGSQSLGFHCEFQGISSGWADLYDRTLDGQWVDITGVPPGTYTLVVTVNAAGKIPEANDRHSNVAEVEVLISAP